MSARRLKFITILIERIWGKKRIMEVYLNASKPKGLYGVEAARTIFHTTAAKLSDRAA